MLFYNKLFIFFLFGNNIDNYLLSKKSYRFYIPTDMVKLVYFIVKKDNKKLLLMIPGFGSTDTFEPYFNDFHL